MILIEYYLIIHEKLFKSFSVVCLERLLVGLIDNKIEFYYDTDLLLVQ